MPRTLARLALAAGLALLLPGVPALAAPKAPDGWPPPSATSSPGQRPAASPRAEAPNGTVWSGVIGLAQNGQPVSFINPSPTPYDEIWGVDNRQNDHAILITSVEFLPITTSDPTCDDNLVRVGSTTMQLSQRVEAGAIGNPDAEPTAPWLHSPGFTFQATGSECQGISIGFPVRVTYQDIANADELTPAPPVSSWAVRRSPP